MVARPLPASNISVAALFRVIEAFHPCLIIDEADTFISKSDELRGILNAGNRKSSAVVYRIVGDDLEPRGFSCWGPKTIAGIGELPATVHDRSIVVQMRRKTADERVARLRMDKLQKETIDIRRKALRWAKDSLDALKKADPEMPEGLNDRAEDNWRPLIAIADLAGGLWPKQAREAALELSGIAGEEAQTLKVLLLSDLQKIFEEKQAASMATSVVIQELVKMDDRPWPTYRKDKGGSAPINAHLVAKMLKPFGVKPDHWRSPSGETVRGYVLKDCEDAFRRYIPPLELAQTAQAEESTTCVDSDAEQDPDCANSQVPVSGSK